MIPACINDYCCDVMIDTGSSVSLLSDRVVQALAKEDIVSGIPLIRLLNASSQPVTVKGEITLRVSVGKLAHPFKFIIVQSLVADAILGMDFLEFDLSVSYCRAKENKADPISRRLETDEEEVQERRSKCTVTMVQSTITEDELRTAQLNDVILSKVIQELQNGTLPSTTRANEWKKTPLLRYAQIADSLSLCNGVLHRTIRLEPNEAAWKVPVKPESLRTH
ncbi:Asp protease 2 domain containing protein, partial [Trichuris trichiura]